MPPRVEILVDGQRVLVHEGTPLVVALFDAGVRGYRTSVSGEPRAPICGMGICFECRVTVDGTSQRRSCLLPCVAGMIVETAAGGRDREG
ncbi:MAG TPA: (2Fe-2S)-binding protein [Gemmatimonadaceae bacterium]|nr:(2Fe-2S)-binding protein [Gemmatimonadaceae bacterium]